MENENISKEFNELENEQAVEIKSKKWYKRPFLVGGIVIAFLFIGYIVPPFLFGIFCSFTINQVGEKILNVDKMSVGRISISPLMGEIYIRDLFIGKPKNGDFKEDILNLKEMDFSIELSSLFSKKIIIDKLLLNDLTFCFEKPLTGKSNVDALLESLKSSSEEEPKEIDDKEDADEKVEKYIGARIIDVEGVNLRVVYAGVLAPTPNVSLDMKDVGIENDLTPTEFGIRVFGNFINVFNRIDFSGIGSAVSNAASGATSAATELGGTVVDSIGSLFSSDKDKKDPDKK